MGQVFEFMESDLEAVIRDRTLVLSPADVKAYIRMLLQVLRRHLFVCGTPCMLLCCQGCSAFAGIAAGSHKQTAA